MANENEDSVIRPGQNGGGQSLQRVGFGSVETVQQRETQGMALAARAQAEVQARYIMADRKPRNLEQVRVRLLEHCKRPRFAQIAEYAKPVGGQKIKGPSIRFVETALLEYGNNLPEATIVYDDDFRRITRVSVTDLERNVTYYDDATVEKFVERKKPKDGDEILSSRTNSYGDQVYRIRATEDDFANKAASAVSKKTRNLGLRVLPADLVDEAMWQCEQTRKDADAKDPKAALRQVIDYFASLRVLPADLEQYLGHAVDQVSPAELDELRAVYATVRDGEAKWTDMVEVQKQRRGEVEKLSKPAEDAQAKIKARIADVRAKQKAAKDKAANDAKPDAKAETKPVESKPAETKPEPKAEPKVEAKPAPAPADDEDLTEEEKRLIEQAEREEAAS